MKKKAIEQLLNEKKMVVVEFNGVEASVAPRRETKYILLDKGLEVSSYDEFVAEQMRYDEGTARSIIDLVDGIVTVVETGVIAESHDELANKARLRAIEELGLF